MDPELRWELVCPPLFRTQPSLTVAPLRHGRTCHPSSFCKPLSAAIGPSAGRGDTEAQKVGGTYWGSCACIPSISKPRVGLSSCLRLPGERADPPLLTSPTCGAPATGGPAQLPPLALASTSPLRSVARTNSGVIPDSRN